MLLPYLLWEGAREITRDFRQWLAEKPPAAVPNDIPYTVRRSTVNITCSNGQTIAFPRGEVCYGDFYPVEIRVIKGNPKAKSSLGIAIYYEVAPPTRAHFYFETTYTAKELQQTLARASLRPPIYKPRSLRGLRRWARMKLSR